MLVSIQKLKRLMPLAIFILSFGVLFTACDTSDNDDPDIVEVIQGEDNLSSLATAIESAGLTADLQGDGPFTVFAPINDSLDAVSGEVPAEAMPAVIQYHVVEGEITAADISPGTTEIETLEGDIIYVTKDESGNVFVNGGRTQFPIGGTVVESDLMASNGVVHKVNGVFTPNQLTTVAGNIAKRLAYDTGSLVGLAALAPDVLAGLQGDPTGGDGITVFAPNNSAIAAVEDQLPPNNENNQISALLLYHAAPGTYLADDLTSGELPTLLQNPQTGEPIPLIVDTTTENPLLSGAGGGSADPTVTDIESINGVVHIVDGVLFPPTQQ
ncbi:MAG: fasciclin domain-containing protein [Bacteroidota bacterium]